MNETDFFDQHRTIAQTSREAAFQASQQERTLKEAGLLNPGLSDRALYQFGHSLITLGTRLKVGHQFSRESHTPIRVNI